MSLGVRGRTAAAALLLALAGCLPAPRTSVPPGERWARLHAGLDSLGAMDSVEPGLARIGAARAERGAPAWLAADLAATDSLWRRRAAAPSDVRAGLAAADHALARATAMLAHDSLSAARQAAASAVEARARVHGASATATLRATLALARVSFRMARVGEADTLAMQVLERLAPAARTAHPLAAEAEELRGRIVKNFAGTPRRGDALAHYTRALAIRERVDGPRALSVALLHQELGNLERMARRPEAALGHLELALAIRRERLGERHEEVASTLSAMAFLSASLGDWRAVERGMERSLAAMPEGDTMPPATLTTRLGLLGQARRRLGRVREALPPLRTAIAAAETTWARSDRDGASSVQSGLSLHRELALALAEQGESEAAFEALERSHSRSWAMDEAGEPWRGLLARVQRACPDDVALVAWPRTTLAPPGGDYPMWACVVRSRGPVAWVRLDRLREWAPRDRSLREALLMELLRASQWPLRIEDTRVVDSLGRALGREWFAPLELHLGGAKRLVVFGPELMAGGPLALLRDANGARVDERFTIQYAPSALAFARLAERPAASPGFADAVLVGAPAAAPADSGRWAPLSGASGELAALARLFPAATLLTGRDASAARLRALEADGAFGRTSVLHLAAHVEVDLTRVLHTAFVLAPDVPGGRHGSRLTAREIESDWRLGVRLVSLAGCRSGLGLNSASEGLLGLQSAFLRAGARNVLVSVWRVDDAATERLMTEFYRRLTDVGTRPDAAEALRGAQQAVRAWRSPDGRTPFAHPVYWAGFVLVGAGG